MVKPCRLQIDTKNVNSLRKVQLSNNKTQLRSLLGLCNVYGRFLEDFTGMVHHVNNLLKKGGNHQIGWGTTRRLPRINRSRVFITSPCIMECKPSVFSLLARNRLQYWVCLITNLSRPGTKNDCIIVKVRSGDRRELFSIPTRMPGCCVGTQSITPVFDFRKDHGVHRTRCNPLVIDYWRA